MTLVTASTRLRILIAHSFYRQSGGEDRYVSQQYELMRQFHDVRLEARENANLSEDLATAAGMVAGLRERGRLRRSFGSFSPDVVHLHNPYPALGPAVHVVAREQGVPLVQTVHNLRLRCPNGFQFTEGAPCRRCEGGRYENAVEHRCFPSRSQAAAYAATLWAHRFVFRLDEAVDLFVAPSRFLAGRLADWGFGERVEVVRNFTAVPDQPPPIGDRGLYLGRLSSEKGVDVLLRALAELGDPPFDVVGTGPHEGELQRLATELRLRRVRFHGQIAPGQVGNAIAKARYVAFPSLWDENAPLAALEAMAAGRPLVASANGGLPELTEDSRGVLSEAGDVHGLASAIAQFGDRSVAADSGARAREFVIRECTGQHHATRLNQAYARALKGRLRDMSEAPAPVPFVARVSTSSRVATASSSPRPLPSVLMVHCYYRDLGGENLSFEAEASLLRDAGVRVTTYTRDNREWDRIGRVAQARVGLGTTWAPDVFTDLRRVIRRVRPDVVHFQNTFPLISPAGLHAANRSGVAVVQALRNYRMLCAKAVLYRDGRICHDCVGKVVPYPAVQHACYHDSKVRSAAVVGMQVTHRALGTWKEAVDLYVAPSDFARRLFVESGIGLERIAVKPNFVDTDPGTNTSVGSYALYAGRLAPEKGVGALIRAWSAVPDLPLLVAGDGPSRKEMEAAIVRLAVGDRVQLLGSQPPSRVMELLRDARLVVFPSEWYETFGRTAAEAFACGVPVVAARLGAMAEVVEDGVSGRLFEPGNADDLAAAVRDVVRATVRSSTMSVAARAAYEARFTAASNLDQLLAIYRRAIMMRAQSSRTRGSSRAAV